MAPGRPLEKIRGEHHPAACQCRTRIGPRRSPRSWPAPPAHAPRRGSWPWQATVSDSKHRIAPPRDPRRGRHGVPVHRSRPRRGMVGPQPGRLKAAHGIPARSPPAGCCSRSACARAARLAGAALAAGNARRFTHRRLSRGRAGGRRLGLHPLPPAATRPTRSGLLDTASAGADASSAEGDVGGARRRHCAPRGPGRRQGRAPRRRLPRRSSRDGTVACWLANHDRDRCRVSGCRPRTSALPMDVRWRVELLHSTWPAHAVIW